MEHEPTSPEIHGLDEDDGLPSTRGRRDGWTPFARRLFLEVLAETGRVSLACEYCGLTKQSAYALRARDHLFAISWDASCELARAPLADALYEKALDGVTDTITKDGEVVAERHRFDSRLSIAVLHRLDKRCDRAADVGAQHLALLRHWDEWIRLVGKGEEQSATALLESSRDSQLGQLPERANPTSEADESLEEEGLDLSDRCWKDDEDSWVTNFPPPPGYDGLAVGEWGEPRYERDCTPEEVAILDADAGTLEDAELAQDEQLRDAWFRYLATEALEQEEAPTTGPGLEPPAATTDISV